MLMPAGQVAGLIREVISIEELVREMVEEAKRLSSELAGAFES